MPVPVNREEFIDLVRKSGVLDDDRISAFSRELNDSGTAIDQPHTLATKMIREGLLTSFQAKQLLQGKWRRFLINGKYKLLELIGTGGMGQVYLCEHIYMRRLVALKVLPLDKKDDSTIERFYREARAAAALDHPNIVRAFDIDREQGPQGQMHYLVMEYVDGASLQEIVSRRGPMDPTRAAHYISQAALGLQHAHEAGLVHRDIKPGNLLLDRKGTVKVLDLGLARFFQGSKDNLTERFDEKNAILGTADYLAPEQARGEAVDIRADIYGLGATFYFLLAGKAPFEDGTITQKLLWSQTKSPKPVAEHRPDLPPDMISIIDKMMAKDPEARFAVPNAIVEALEPWTKTPIEPPPSSEMPRRSPAALAPGSQNETPMLPSTPSPRTVPSDLLRRKSPPTPAVTASKPASNRVEVVRSSARSDERRPTPDRRAPARPHRRTHASPSSSKNLIFAAAGGGAALVILGIVLAWLVSGNKSRHATQTADAGPVAAHSPSPSPQRGNPPTPPPAPSDPNVIAPDQAGKHLNETRTVEMVIRRVGKANTADRYFLNSKENYTDADNFTVTFTKKVLDQLAARGIKDLDTLKNKKIRVTGKIAEYQNRPQIAVDDADAIQVMTR